MIYQARYEQTKRKNFCKGIAIHPLNLDNLVVRPQCKSVEKFAKVESWYRLDGDSFTESGQKDAGLPTAMLDNDEDAKHFDMLVLCTQLAFLQAKLDFVSLRERMQAIAKTLEEQEAIPRYQGADGADSVNIEQPVTNGGRTLP